MRSPWGHTHLDLSLSLEHGEALLPPIQLIDQGSSRQRDSTPSCLWERSRVDPVVLWLDECAD